MIWQKAYHFVDNVKPADTIPTLCTVTKTWFSTLRGIFGITTESGKSNTGRGPIAVKLIAELIQDHPIFFKLSRLNVFTNLSKAKHIDLCLYKK